MIGLSGAHRTGKTTLAMRFAQEQDIPFIRTSASEVYRQCGMDPAVDYPIGFRVSVQEAILHTFERQYAEAQKLSKLWIADRTPIDLASYMLADIQRATVAEQPVLANHINDYVQRCLKATNRWFGIVVLVQPGIATVNAEGKALACPAFMEHLNQLQMGLMMDERLGSRHYFIPRRYVALSERMQALTHAARSAVEQHRTNVDLGQVTVH